MIRERVKAGLERARAQGTQLGRPSTEPGKVEAIKAGLRAGGVGIIKLAKLHGVGVGTVQRIKAGMNAVSPGSLGPLELDPIRGTTGRSI